MKGVDQISLAVGWFNLDNFESVEMLIKSGLYFVNFSETPSPDTAQVNKVLFEMLYYENRLRGT